MLLQSYQDNIFVHSDTQYQIDIKRFAALVEIDLGDVRDSHPEFHFVEERQELSLL